MALGQAGVKAHGATVYVTLEPCAHSGKTPPCANALIAAGVRKVFVALQDPDPRVEGRGIDMLKAAGIEVDTGLLEIDAISANAGFLSRIVWNRPWITLKVATSIDGKIATRTGDSQWITGPKARRVVHAQRAMYDAVMVGGGTARADDPSLNVRDLGVSHQPVRVVVSRDAHILPQGKLMTTARQSPVWIVHGTSASSTALTNASLQGVKLLEAIETPEGTVNLRSVLEQLAAAGLTRVFCEGGAQLGASLLKEGLVDELITFTAGLVIGADGIPCTAGLGVIDLDDTPRFDLHTTQVIDQDVLQIWRRRN
jgi:diaminohydroxyphosphoribosylaminopyrimidine deaminase/5-amino-6-(5-phosphoribosylamino)uracil reductase